MSKYISFDIIKTLFTSAHDSIWHSRNFFIVLSFRLKICRFVKFAKFAENFFLFYKTKFTRPKNRCNQEALLTLACLMSIGCVICTLYWPVTVTSIFYIICRNRYIWLLALNLLIPQFFPSAWRMLFSHWWSKWPSM